MIASTEKQVVEYSIQIQKLYNEAETELKNTQKINNGMYSQCLEKCKETISVIEKFNPFQINRIKGSIKMVYLIYAEILFRIVGLNFKRGVFTESEKGILITSVNYIQMCLKIEPFDIKAQELYKIIIIYLTMFSNNKLDENIRLLKGALTVYPGDFELHYNIGLMYQRSNKLDDAMFHLKLSLSIIDLKISSPVVDITNLNNFKVKILNIIGSIYISVQDRELAKYFFNIALEVLPNDPDIHNQLGVVYTELRLTDFAINHYKKCINNYKKAHISQDTDQLLASVYMNMGLAYCYEINYPKAIESYNQALKYKPNLSLAYQNKLLDLNYISHLIEDPMYISRAHSDINKIYNHVENDYKISCPNYIVNTEVINLDLNNGVLKLKRKLKIGFISGDYICHPVSYFIHGILREIDYTNFEIHCFSLKVIDISKLFPNCHFHIVKNTSPVELKEKVQEQNIDILFDLSSQTGDNRLDTFVLKPSPIQISYCGYPNTSGLSNMDYHLTDYYCDSDGKTPGVKGKVRESTQKYYTEKLIFLKNCFLSYTPSIGFENLPKLPVVQPCIKNGYLTIGTFNRYNKINDDVVKVWEEILEECPNVRFIVKTKEFLTLKLKEQFLNTWKNKDLLNRIEILDYSDTYQDHLVDYNKMDIALDTFPYSGTTTSAEALLMGTPVLTLFDEERQYHCQNVSSSFMYNCGMEDYIVSTKKEYIEKIKELSDQNLHSLKKNTRDAFINGPICNHKEFTKNFEKTMLEIYRNHSW